MQNILNLLRLMEHCKYMSGYCHNCRYETEDGKCEIQMITGTYPDSWKGEKKHERNNRT